MRIRMLALQMLLLSLSLPAAAGGRIIEAGPKGGKPDLNKTFDYKRLAKHSIDAEYYLEGWNFVFRFESGHVVFGNLVVTNVGWGDNINGTSLSICTPDGKFHHATTENKEDKLTASTQRFAIRTADSVLSGDANGWMLTAVAGDLKALIEVEPMVPGFNWGSGAMYFDEDREDFMVRDYAYPRGKAQGTLVIKGQRVAVKGEAYLDHGVQNILASDFSRRWNLIRGFGHRYTLTLGGFEPKKKFGSRSMYHMTVFDGDRPIWRTNKVRVYPKKTKADKESGYAPPWELHLEAEGYGGKLYGKATAKRKVDSQSVLDSLSSGLRFIVETFVAKPWFHRFDSEMSFTLELEGQEPISIIGPAIYEVMFVDE